MPDDAPPHVAALCGSLRSGSVTRLALRRALDAAEDRGASVDLVDLRSMEIPLKDPDVDPPGDVPELLDRVGAAHALLLGTPMYHGSYAGVLKNALDHCGFDEVEGKTVGLLAVGGGRFPVPALEHLRSVCRALSAWVLPTQVAVPRSHDAVDAGELRDPEVRERVDHLGRRLVEFARIRPDPRTFEGGQNVGATR